MNIAERLRGKADGLQPKIDHLAAPRLVNTRKRRQEDEGRQRDLRKLRATQTVMRVLADMSDNGGMPALFQAVPAVTSKYETWVGSVLSFNLAAATLAELCEGHDPNQQITAHQVATALHTVRDRMKTITSYDEQAAYRAVMRTFVSAGISSE
jgi:hypothetical protein